MAKLGMQFLRDVAIPDDTPNYTGAIRLDGLVRVECVFYRIATTATPGSAQIVVVYEVSADGENWSLSTDLVALETPSVSAYQTWLQQKSVPDFRSPWVRFGVAGPAAAQPASTTADLGLYLREVS